MPRTRNLAAANETLDIKKIVDAINSNTPCGIKLKETFKDKIDSEIESVRPRTGPNRGSHHDFEIKVNGHWMNVEHKGSRSFRKPNPGEVPWKAGVQFHNGGCEKYSLARKYAQVWYDTHIASGSLKTEFNLESEIPSFEEWLKDCKVQSDPKTPFGKELKRKVRAVRGPKSSLLEKRADVLAALDITDEDKATFIREALPIANSVLDEKDFWLSIHGDLDGEFHAVWYPKFRIDTVLDVSFKKNLDLDITFKCANDFEFNGILRWGKGAGFSCLRVDLK